MGELIICDFKRLLIGPSIRIDHDEIDHDEIDQGEKQMKIKKEKTKELERIGDSFFITGDYETPGGYRISGEFCIGIIDEDDEYIFLEDFCTFIPRETGKEDDCWHWEDGEEWDIEETDVASKAVLIYDAGLEYKDFLE